jgi:hypothetical protein
MEGQILPLELSVAEWNIVFANLGRGAYIEVAPIIQKLQQQANERLNPPADTKE